MKKSFWNNKLGRGVSLFIILSLLSTGVSFSSEGAVAKAAAMTGNVAGDHRVVEAPKMDKLVELDGEPAEELNENALLSPAYKIGQYANLLSTTEKAMYKLVVGAVSNYAPYRTSESEAFQKYAYTMEVSASVYNELDSMGSAFQTMFQHVIEATIYDNIDKVQFVMCRVPRFKWFKSGSKYYAQTTAIAYYPYDYAAMNQKLKSARSSFLSSIPKGATPQETEAIIHDALIDNVTYNYGYKSLPAYHSCFTAYGALVEGNAVCDGYSQAMSYLLQAKGIDSLVVTGGVGSTEAIAARYGHAWNLVKIGSEWYEVDSTWDDTGDNNEAARHKYFNVTTAYLENLGSSSHLRAAPYIGSLMETPIATGTTYTYSYMKNHYPNLFTNIVATGITTNIRTADIKTGETVTAQAYLTPSNVTNKYVKWTSSDPSVADVDGGIITGKSSGRAIITATAGSNPDVLTTIAVTVTTPTTGIKLDRSSITMKIGDIFSINASTVPDNADDKSVSWISSNKEVATVNNGKVTATGSGTAVITAVSDANNAIKASCKVTVSLSSGADITVTSGKDTYKYEVLDDGFTVAFKGVSDKKVKTVDIPEVISDANGTKYTVTEIGKSALKGRKKLRKLTVPKTVTTIKKNAFKGCKELSQITIYGDTLEKIESGAFSGISKKATFTIRTSDKAKYKKIVKKIKKAGAKNAKFKRKKK